MEVFRLIKELTLNNTTILYKEDALLLLEAFFIQYPIGVAQNILCERLKLTIKPGAELLKKQDIEDYGYFFSQLDKLVIAASLIYESQGKLREDI